MNELLASCICVTYNRPNLINEMLYCFLAQDYNNKELIIVNDQANVVYEYNDSRVKIYNLQKRFSTLGEKREYSRSLIDGDFMFVMDDDDIYYSKHISITIKNHLKHLEYDIVGNLYSFYSEDNENICISNTFNFFSGTSIKRNYYKNNKFPIDRSCYEDNEFIKNAKTLIFMDNNITFHNRWGMGIRHMSENGDDGNKLYNSIEKNVDVIKNIKLIPILSEKTKLCYI